MSNTSLYPSFIILISILIAIFALKTNIRDKEIDYHDKKAKIIKTNLHMLISYLNIFKKYARLYWENIHWRINY